MLAARRVTNILYNTAFPNRQKLTQLLALNKIVGSRLFWFGNNDDSKNSKTEILIDKNINNDSKSLVSQSGDNSPMLNPLIILPTSNRPIFPHFLSSIFIKDEKTIAAVKSAEGGFISVFMRNDLKASSEIQEIITDMNQLHNVGTLVQVQNIIRTENNGTQLMMVGHRRVTLQSITSFGPPTIGEVKHWKKSIVDSETPTLKAYTNEVLAAARELINMNPLLQEQLQWVTRVDLSNPFRLADFAILLTSGSGYDFQRVLEASDPVERLSITLELLMKEKELTKLQQEISKQVEEKVSKTQREYFLNEQLKNIKKELGIEKDDKKDLILKYTEVLTQLKERNVKSDIIDLFAQEINKLDTLEKNSAEFNVTRTYLDWLVAIPFGLSSQDILNINIARGILNNDHYGLDEIKARILEFIAVGKLKGTITGKILCFIGPPGVGKTSIAKSIASALNKKFYRFSVGGLTDTAEIKGHRRTYVGAMPGKPIQCLKTVNFMNPLILIDEIDKLGRSYSGGDPASALLELLDPNQNTSFVDHYLDIPIDFSNVLFVCTANDENNIPGPLLDRMEIIRLSEAIHNLIKNYSRESGIRSLEKLIEKIIRKVAFNFVENMDSENNDEVKKKFLALKEPIHITVDNLEQYAGKPKFLQENIYDNSLQLIPEPFPVGVIMGLGWSPSGGSPIFIETAAIPIAFTESGGGVNVVTGQLGSVMKESVNIAYTFARKFVSEINNNNNFFKSHQLHLHVPEGAVSKDGPSAGVAMTSSLISIALNVSCAPKVAMTGEISLTGKVLPVGGIKEKTLAAKRAGADTIILPFANKRDYEELPPYVKDELKFHFVSEYKQVFDIIFQSFNNNNQNSE
eukprot:gene12542-16820_t